MIVIPFESILIDNVTFVEKDSGDATVIGGGIASPVPFSPIPMGAGTGGGFISKIGNLNLLVIPYVDKNGIKYAPRFQIKGLIRDKTQEWAEIDVFPNKGVAPHYVKFVDVDEDISVKVPVKVYLNGKEVREHEIIAFRGRTSTAWDFLLEKPGTYNISVNNLPPKQVVVYESSFVAFPGQTNYAWTLLLEKPGIYDISVNNLTPKKVVVYESIDKVEVSKTPIQPQSTITPKIVTPTPTQTITVEFTQTPLPVQTKTPPPHSKTNI